MKKYLIIFSILMVCLSCTKSKSQQKVMTTDFQLTECEALYKNKKLPFGKPVEEWINIFGNKYRNIPDDAKSYYKRYIWDDLGIVVEEEGHNSNNPKKTTKMYIFYSNLTSPAGHKGKLKFAYERESETYLISEYKKNNPSALTKELEQEFIQLKSIGGKEGPDKYIYPYTTYKQSVTIDGAEVRGGMLLKELNKNRKEKDLQIFTFRDDNMDGVNETGSTKGDNGEYWNDNRKNDCGNKQNYYFLNSVQYSDSELEYIKVGYRAKGDDSPYF
ncbi:hypothetical protein V2E39_04350 [Chryseobacterium arthrosphaerae]|uniref:DUF7738 domain-containing protein n=2 Tax=Chryseobacterium arthrosphaerae TaxID=651561 RepID=A0A1B8ZQ27_9FLAO|nr:hypothetical protein [Chryseobacterium arthrosphaerae]AYZ11812.1 hypothetical protein EGY05_07695 [Chryseobacterium arthrosphaerae]OCA73647.1 hypothetical protein BBI00_04495 [Chryseobacterium arthrosphaerae]